MKLLSIFFRPFFRFFAFRCLLPISYECLKLWCAFLFSLSPFSLVHKELSDFISPVEILVIKSALALMSFSGRDSEWERHFIILQLTFFSHRNEYSTLRVDGRLSEGFCSNHSFLSASSSFSGDPVTRKLLISPDISFSFAPLALFLTLSSLNSRINLCLSGSKPHTEKKETPFRAKSDSRNIPKVNWFLFWDPVFQSKSLGAKFLQLLHLLPSFPVSSSISFAFEAGLGLKNR